MDAPKDKVAPNALKARYKNGKLLTLGILKKIFRLPSLNRNIMLRVAPFCILIDGVIDEI